MLLFKVLITNKIIYIESNNKLIKKLRESKIKKLSKFQNLFKNRNLSKFDIKKAVLRFLIFNISKVFNYL